MNSVDDVDWYEAHQSMLEEHVDVRIGIIQAPRELAFETDATADEVLAALNTAQEAEGKFASFTDTKGSQILVNPSSISYIEIGEKASGRVGFVS